MLKSTAGENQYRIATTAVGLCARGERGVLEATGRDRAAWLHNLITNAVKTLQPGEGNYAFATNVKGRAVFDLNVLALEDRLWLDVDRRWIDAARRHLTRYTITEDVALSDVTKEQERFALVGPAAVDVITRMGLGNLRPMAQLQHLGFTFAGQQGRMIRHDFAGLIGAELVVPASVGDALLSTLLDAGRAHDIARVDRETIETLRIEAGIPASVSDIDEEVIPPETGQIERGISYHKGCYLGQEVIERMRSHNIVARRLVGVRIGGEEPPPTPTPLQVGEADVGRLTSVCWSYALGAALGLGYVRTPNAKPGQPLSVVTPGGPLVGEVVALPVRTASREV